MDFFTYHNGELHCEEVPLSRIAQEVGTPVYVYSQRTLERHAQVFTQAFANLNAMICFAVKSNSNIHILRVLAEQGIGADIVSGGELYRALKAGIPREKILFAGVGKKADEMEYALSEDIFMFNVESMEELDLLQATAKRLNKTASVALRVNPDVDARTHPYISTGLKENKFGIPMESALESYRYAHSLSCIRVRGIHCHIGSQLTAIEPFVDAFVIIKNLVRELLSENIPIEYIDMGGGLGITYDQEKPPLPTELAAAIAPHLKEVPCRLILEPGRAIAGNTGAFLTRVLFTKDNGSRKFLIVDGAMNDLARPSLYGSFHDIRPAVVREGNTEVVDIVGPVCESGDFFAKNRPLPPCHPGDILSLMSAGAYGFTMSSNYNSRPRAAEVLVSGDRYRVIRQRETYEDLTRLEELS
ncbi:diaminopimelate decarboxylase [Desulfurispirillum indicum S5]|uniref:Diaminopimelate decarboxylase n=1 Tax=Desulfurispirillum indicum (strain ATCC BAA-1389 / DSM 22839 / S5) TaxID=653733 RepID=E6W4T2_DESIS|nr:diaminopimelate decarboxylase [Desulfurispirillum indicum]ADU64810.1 diaminopimelate decarboxylase [Desulfurispirillum indicum S5]